MAQNDFWKTGGTPVEEPAGGDWWKTGGTPVEPEKPGYGLKDFGGDLASVVTKGVMAVPQAAVGLADIVTGGRAGKALEDAGVRFKEANQIADSWKSDALKAQQKEFQDAEGIGGKAVAALSNPGLIASTVAESIPSMFAGGALAKGAGLAIPALAGRAGIAAAGEGAVMAGSQAENIRQQTADGLLTPGQSALAAATGVAGGAIGALGAKAGKALGVGDIDTMIANGASQGAREGVGLAGRVGRGALAEGVLEELPQSLAETAFGNIALDKPVTEGMDEAAVLGTLSGGVMGGAAGAMSRPAKPSQQMGIDPGAGPLSRAAAASVDSQPVPQPLGASITGTAPADLMGRATDPLAAQIAEGRQQAEAGSAVQESPAAASEPVPLEQRSLDELRQAFRSAQEPAIRKTLAAEIRKRREAMPDPLAPVQPQQEIALEPQAPEAVQSQPQEAQAEPAEPVALGQPLTDAGTNLLGRGADPLQSIIQGQSDARRAADVLRGTRNSSSGAGADITNPGVANDVGSPDGATGAAAPVVPQQGQPGAGERPAADQAALRPDGWRTTAIKAGRVARSLGLDPKGKRLKEIVAEIDAVDAGSNVQNTPSSAAGTEAQASPVEARAPEGGNAAADTGVPAAPGAGDVQADGVKPAGIAEAAKQRRAAALDRIAKGTAYFGTKDKAGEFITKSGIGDTHNVVQAKAGRFEIRAKEAAAPAAVSQPNPEKKPEASTDAEPASQKAPAEPPKRKALLLRAVGQKMAEQGAADQSRERNTNTARRASMAASADADARKREAMGKTLVNLADAIESGAATKLAGITTKAQVEALEKALVRGMVESERGLSYVDQQRQKGRAPNEQDVRNARFPKLSWSNGGADSARLLEAIKGKKGSKEVADMLRFGPPRAEQLAALKKLGVSDSVLQSGFGWWNIEMMAEVGRLERAGIKTDEDLRGAIAEYIEYRDGPKKEDPIKAAERKLIGQKVGLDFFPTPKAVADRMVEAAGIEPGMRVLEPSAGNGNLADAAKAAGAEVDAVEVSDALREVLSAKGYELVGRDFLSFDSTEKYDAIIMNPPFSNRLDAEHIQRAFGMLKPGGRLVAIAGEGVFNGIDKKAQAFRAWLEEVGASVEKLPAATFKDVQLLATTGANARLIEIEAPKAQPLTAEESSPVQTAAQAEKPAEPVNPEPSKAAQPKAEKPAEDAATQGDGDQDIQLDASSAGVATGTSYATATGAQQKAATAFAERLSKGRDSFVLMDAVNPSGARQQEAQTVANLAKTMFGREVVFVKFKGRPLFNGAVSTTDPGKIFVNIESARPMMAVLGHELLHELRKSNPAAYNQLAKTLKTVTKDDYIYEALLKKKYRDQGLNWTPQDISEELYGDIVGDNFMDPKFWEAIAGDKPILAKQLYRAVMNWLNKIAAMFKRMKVRQDGSMVLTLAEQADGSRPFGTQKYLQDIEAARAAVAQAMRRFGKTTPQGQADALSIAGAVDQIKQFDVKSAPKSAWAHYRGMSLQALGRRQLVDLYAEELPQLETYNDLVQQMDAEKNDTGAEADRVAQDWGSLKGGMDRKLAELMHDATLAKMDPDKPMPAGYFKRDYDALKARFDALSPEAKTLYRKARDMYVDHYKAVQQAIKDRVERSEMSEGQKRKMMADLDDKLFKELKGVYFPLARFGQYVIVVKDANGEVVNVTRAETVKEAEQARKELQKAFPASSGNTVGKVLKQAEFNAGRDAVGKGFMADLMGALDEKGVDDELRDTVAQLYLSSLPDLSWAKHGIHRKGTPGFSQDARRAFAQNMFHGARYLAKLRHADRLQDLLIEMQDHIKAYEGVEEYDSIQAQQVVDEMVKRHEWLMNPKASPVSTALTSFGFLFHMGLSPASAMVNLTQTALVAYPQMGAKWGFARAGAALTKASEETVRAKNDLSQVLKGDELDAFNRAVKDGTIDVTMAHDLAGIAQGEDQGVMWKIRPVMRWASFMFHHAEKFNRQATFLAAYRLAKAANPAATQSQLYEQAKQATYDGHFDYSSSNRARIMQGNWQRVIFLFKNYAQHMVYALARNAYLSVKALDPKERSQARKTLGGILAAHAAAAGVLGLPIVGPLLTVASWIGGDDDEPWDAEVAMQNAMAEMIGPKAAEVVARGFSRLTPFDLSGRVALNKLILPDVQEGLEGKEWAESAMAAALGPVAGIGVNMARGAQKITEGDYMRGLEDMMPTALRGPLKAMRYASEGAVDKTGVTITEDVSAAGVIGQASGFSPSQVRRDTERRSAIYSYDRALLERRSVLMRMFAQAQMSGDLETAQEVRKDIQRFNEKNPSRRITPMNLAASIRNRRKRIEEAEQGVYLPSKRRDALEAVTF